MSRPAYASALVLALAALVWFSSFLGSRDLWHPDEPEFALIAREMSISGDWVVPTRNGKAFAEKPPVYYWSMVLAAKLTGGVDETSARLPCAIAGAGSVFWTVLLAASLYGRSAGIWAGLILLTMFRFWFNARFAQADMLLAFFVTTSIACWYFARRTGRRAWLLGFYLGLALAILSKGPVAAVFVVLAVGGVMAACRDGWGLRRLGLAWGIPLLAALVLPWYLLAWQRAGWDFIVENVWRQNVVRATDAWNHQVPWYFYFAMIWADAAPWSFLIPAAAAETWAKDSRSRARLAWLWLLLPMLALSFSGSKQGKYLLPGFPALAILLGHVVDLLATGRSTAAGAWFLSVRLLLVQGAVLLAVGCVLPLAAVLGFQGFEGVWALGPAAIVGTGAVLAIGGIAQILAALRPAWTGSAVLVSILLIEAWLAAVALPAADALKSPRPFAQEVARLVPPGAPLGCFRAIRPAWAYYSGRPVEELKEPEELRAFLARHGGEPVFVITRESHRRDFAPRVPELDTMFPWAERTVGEQDMVLLGSRPAPDPDSGGGGSKERP